MALRKTCSCDICGKEAETYSEKYYPCNTYSVYRIVFNVKYGSEYYDLCKDCYFKLKDCIAIMRNNNCTKRYNNDNIFG